MLQVTVPPNSASGQELHVESPDGRVISAIIPPGHGPGQTFYIQIPTTARVGVHGAALNNAWCCGFLREQQQQQPIHNKATQPKKYKRCSEEMLLLHNKGLVKLKVPKGLVAGDRFKVRIPDGRTVNAVVPQGNVSEFHLKVDQSQAKKQNWHNNPLAVAPMIFGPLFM